MCLEKAQSTSQGSSNVLWAFMRPCILQVNYLFALLSSTWDDSNVLKKSQKCCNKAVVSCIVFTEVVKCKIVCFSLKDFRQRSSHTSAERYQHGRKQLLLTLNIFEVLLVNVYREDFQSILRKQRPFPFFSKCNSTKVMGRGPNTNTRNLGIFFQETVKLCM